MPQEILTTPEFRRAHVCRSLAFRARSRGVIGSEILKIAGDIREMVAAGRSVCNLTVGDFNPRQFPIPAALLERLQSALAAGETNYPPSNGLGSLREAVTRFTAKTWGASYPVESVLIASGARPILYGAYRAVVNPGDEVIYPVPSWNNNHYCWMVAAKGVALPTTAEHGFMPTVEQIAPHLGTARMLCLNSPLNPTGTVIAEEQLRSILEAVVDENRRRTSAGHPHLFLLHDQVYSLLVFGSARHIMPVSLVPESAPWVISLDGASKGFAATGTARGLGAGGARADPADEDLSSGHVGAWAPRPEQVARGRVLEDDTPACRGVPDRDEPRACRRVWRRCTTGSRR